MNAGTSTGRSLKSSPQPFKPSRRRARVLHRVRDVPVPEVVLDQSSVEPLVSEIKACRVTQHVRVDVEGKSCPLTSLRDNVVNCLTCERPALTQE